MRKKIPERRFLSARSKSNGRTRKHGWRHLLRERSWTVLSSIVMITTLANVGGLTYLAPRAASADEALGINGISAGSITVNKYLKVGSNWILDNTAALNLGFKWTIDDGVPAFDMGQTVSDVTFGSHVVAENTPTSNSLTAGYFISGTTNSCDNPQEAQGHAVLDVQSTDEIVVNFCNYEQTPTLGAVTVHKQVDADGNGSYEGGDDQGNAAGFAWQLNGSADKAFGNTPFVVVQGEQSITENTQTGWTSGWFRGDDISCQEAKLNSEFPITPNIEAGETFTVTLCNALHPASVIQGTKYYDWNRNNATDPGDQPLANWTIFLDLNDNDQPDLGETTTTDVNGHYSFTELEHGEYDVCEVLPDGWWQGPISLDTFAPGF